MITGTDNSRKINSIHYPTKQIFLAVMKLETAQLTGQL